MIPYFDGFDLNKHVVIIDDVKYDCAPETIQYGYGDGYGVVGDTVLTAGLTRVSQVQTVSSNEGWWSVETGDTEPTNKLTNNSVSKKMAWNANWNQSSPMSVCMRDHLMGLSVTQRPFWIQFDEEMSREYEKLTPIDDLSLKFQLPTYPVAYHTTASETADNTYNLFPYIQLYDDTNTLIEEPALINPETGLIVFTTGRDVVYVKYLWRAFVRVKAISLDNIQWSQDIYGGTVSFEQVEADPVVDRFDNKYRNGNCLKFDEEVGSIDDSTIIRTNCPNMFTDVPNIAKSVSVSNCVSTDDTFTTGSITIPANHYITGVEVLDYVAGRQLHCVTPLAETTVKTRIKFMYGTAPVFSSFYEKQTQTDAIQNHAIINTTDVPASATDISFGGQFDVFGKPVGVYRGSDLLSGMVFNNTLAIPTTSNCGAYLGSLSATPTNGLTAYTKKDGSTVSPTSSTGYSVAGTTLTLPMVELTDSAASAAILEAYVDGGVTFAITGPVGARMTTIRLQLTLTLESTAVQSGRTYVVETSLGQVTIPSDDISKTITFDDTLVVPLVSGAGSLEVPMYYYVKTAFDENAPGQTTTYKAKVAGSLTYTLGYGCASTPSINNFGVRIHHAPACPTIYKYHTTAAGTGSSSTATPILGVNGGLMRSSDGTTSGTGELYCRTFNYETFKNDSLVVGAIAKFKCRRVGVPGVASNLITNGNFNSGNSGFLSEYTYNGVDGSGNLDEQAYSVVTNPNSVHALWYGFTDHTADGTANMLVVNGQQGVATVSGDWSFTVSPGTSNTSGNSPLTHSSSHVITATYIGSSPTLPEYVKINVPHTFTIAGATFVPVDDTFSFYAESSLGFTDSYSTYSGPNRTVTANKELTINLSGGTGTYTLDMDTNAAWTATSPPGATITHSVGTMTLIDGPIPATKYFWRQNLTLSPSTTYTFEYYARKINSAIFPNADAIIRTTINGSIIDTTTISSVSGWTKVSFNYTTGVGTTYDIRLVMPSGATPGNDVAVDDISLVGPTGTGKLYMHIGSESSGNPFKQFTLPLTSNWVEYQLGAEDDMWGYSANFAEIPRQYPTADGADLNTWFSISFNQDNNVGGYYEFENVRTQLFLLHNPTGGTILE
jgi:hypothetical protein